MERTFWFRLAVVVVSLSAIVYLVDALRRFWGFLGDVLLAIFLAWLVASILLHVINSLMRIPRMRRWMAITIVYLALITLVLDFALLVVPATVSQVIELMELLPGLVDQIPHTVASLESSLAGIGLTVALSDHAQFLFDYFDQAAEAAGVWASANAGDIIQSVFHTLFLTGLVIVLSFYFVLDGGRRLNEALKVLPPKAEREVRFVLRTIDEAFYGYVRGMLLISLLYGAATAIVMMAVGLPAALPTAIIAAILLAVPFVGDWLALILPSVIALIAGGFITLLIVFGSLFFFQQVMLSAVTPRILGQAVRMPAMIVVVAVILGARLAGIPGALMGVPVAAVIYTLSVHYGMRIRRAREAREAEAMAMANGRSAPVGATRGSRAEHPGPWTQPTQPVPVAGGAPEDEGIGNFEDRIREALDDAYEGPTPSQRRPRRHEEPS